MSSDARKRANKLNAQKSSGPKTEAGKKRSRCNRLKHGLCAEHVLLPHENAEMLEEIRNDLIEGYEPTSNWELRLIDEAAMAYFRVLRSRRFERGLFNLRLRAEAAQAASDEQPDPDEGIALALYADSPERMKNFFRYDAAAGRAYHLALRELDLARKHRLQAQAKQAQTTRWLRSAICRSRSCNESKQWRGQSCRLRSTTVRPTNAVQVNSGSNEVLYVGHSRPGRVNGLGANGFVEAARAGGQRIYGRERDARSPGPH